MRFLPPPTEDQCLGRANGLLLALLSRYHERKFEPAALSVAALMGLARERQGSLDAVVEGCT